MDKPVYKPLDMRKLKDKKHIVVPTDDALKDVVPIKWDEEVINGNKRVVLVSKN